jgi:general secretion pathway protein A
MYLQYYGLQDFPFSLTPDPRFLYRTASYEEVQANLHYGIQHGKGLLVVTGEAGTGKTTLLRALLARLDRSVLTVNLVNSRRSVPELYERLAAECELGPYTSNESTRLKLERLLTMRQARGLRTVLILDEAHGLSGELLEEVRLLLNHETYTEKQLQILLAGQPELRQLLNQPALRQLKQRISLRCELKPLQAAEVAEYLRARLKVAGAARLDLFTANAVALIYRVSEGIPRLINNICDNALLAGYALNARPITSQVIADVASALDLLNPMIEADPRAVLAGNLPALPIMRDEVEEHWLGETPPTWRRRREPGAGEEEIAAPPTLQVVPAQPPTRPAAVEPEPELEPALPLAEALEE